MERVNISSGRPWESVVGYSRAVRIGSSVHVSGTTGTDEQGRVTAPRDGYTQAAVALKNIASALAQAGASMHDVVRTRMFVTDITRWRDFARAHAEAFGAVRPATTMVEVRALIDPEMLIEIEAEAIVPQRP